MLGSSLTIPPSSRNEICSEQTRLVPARLRWQWALIHASIRSFLARGSAPITIARQAWFSVVRASNRQLRLRAPGSALQTAGSISDALVLAPSPRLLGV